MANLAHDSRRSFIPILVGAFLAIVSLSGIMYFLFPELWREQAADKEVRLVAFDVEHPRKSVAQEPSYDRVSDSVPAKPNSDEQNKSEIASAVQPEKQADAAAKPAAKAVPAPEEKAPPVPAKVSEPVATSPKPSSKPAEFRFVRRRATTEQELEEDLRKTPVLALDAVPGSSMQILNMARLPQNQGVDIAPVVMSARPDLRGLPIRQGKECRLDGEPAKNLETLSRKLRVHLEASLRDASAGDHVPLPDVLEQRLLGGAQRGDWLWPEAIPTLLQLLMAEGKQVRLVLVKVLSHISGKEASQGLAQRALYELNPDVREAAVVALKDRNASEYQDYFIQAFQHPWPPVADHAAEAIVALHLEALVPKLIPMLECTDPQLPVKVEVEKRPEHMLSELVRINHLSNCLLCHPPSFSRTDLVRGRVPDPTQPLPAPVSTPKYYEGDRGTFVQASSTYLKQDFSVPMFIEKPGPWPNTQRFDFMVLRRRINNLELTSILQQKSKKPTSDPFPQRQSLLFALQKLTGSDPGPRPEDWLKPAKKNLPPQKPIPGGQAVELSTAIVKAPIVLQEQILEHYRHKAGVEYTDAVALALPQLSESSQVKGREILAERLAKLSVAELRDKLRDSDEEVRNAAILACGKSGAKRLVPDLIPFLARPDSTLVWSVRRVLFGLTDQDFGPALDASESERTGAINRWNDWLKRQGE
jgi:hypothetical protein